MRMILCAKMKWMRRLLLVVMRGSWAKFFTFARKLVALPFQRFHHPRSNFHVSNSLLGLWVLIFSQNPAFADRYNADN